MFGSLDSIGSLASSDLCKDSSLVNSRKLEGMTSRQRWQVGMEGSKCPGYSRLAEVESGSNSVSRVTMGGQGEDVFLLSRGGGMHWK